ncbi:SdpI family protein [Peptoniphilus catoniae]|uniref:SdpI family protein n=1 Tax=Peptoniphilus catoniae TaxID=1660341 RepID=UPI0015D60ED6|nr:SdpI family protein [Peptoniphilus catoniae]
MKRKTTFKIGLLIFIIPFIIRFVYYNRLPDTVAIHFNSNDIPDSFASKSFALFGLPLIMLGIYIISYFVTSADPKRKNQGDYALNVVLIGVPILCLVTTYITIAYALGKDIKVGFYLTIFLSLLFIAIGNYLPKTKRNYSIGIRVPWTLNSDYVWEKTHRLAGYLWVVCGILMLLASIFFYNILAYIEITLIALMVAIPVAYSYLLYKKEEVN